MTTTYNTHRVICQRLIPLLKRNLSCLSESDREIAVLEIKRFYERGDRGQKTGEARDQK